jgi:prefoldin subunit 5
MGSQFDSGTAANQDWSKFDFTRWNLDDLNLDPKTATLATWLRDVTLTPQGSQKFADGLTVVKAGALQSLNVQVDVLQKRASAIDSELESRLSTTRKQISAIEERIRVGAVPVVAAPDPESFQVAAKVLDQAQSLGLPGLYVRLYDTKSPQATLASATTDANGNAVLKLNRDQVDHLAKSGAVLAAEVLTSNNKAVFTGGAVPPPQLNETGTVMAPIGSSADAAPHLNAASALMARQQDLLNKATVKLEDLQTRYGQLKSDLQQQLQETQAIVSDLQSGPGSLRVEQIRKQL